MKLLCSMWFLNSGQMNKSTLIERSLPRQNIAFSFLTQSRKGAVTTFENR